MMIHVYLDDMRPCPPGFVLARNSEECLLLLRECEVNILSLDHDLGPDEPNGSELVSEMVARRLYAKQIYLHSSDPIARQTMYQMLYTNKPEGVTVYNRPVPSDVLDRLQRSRNGLQ